jgi:hypothetical protein
MIMVLFGVISRINADHMTVDISYPRVYFLLRDDGDRRRWHPFLDLKQSINITAVCFAVITETDHSEGC